MPIIRFPVIDLTKTGENITRLMKQNSITVKMLQEIFEFEYPEAIENLDNVVLEENDVKDTRKIF